MEAIEKLPKLSTKQKELFKRVFEQCRAEGRCDESKLRARLPENLYASFAAYTKATPNTKRELRLYFFSGGKIKYCANKHCNAIPKFRWTGFSKYCCVTCAIAGTSELRKETCKERYGGHPSRNKEVRQRISEGVRKNNSSYGKRTKKKRHYWQDLPQTYTGSDENFYVYALLDPRRSGIYRYGKWSFKYEPFYIGKGSGQRAHFHLFGSSAQDRNLHKKRKISKIIRELGVEPIVCIKKKNLTEEAAHRLERNLIQLIGRLEYKDGPLTNLTDGGEGSAGRSWTKKQRQKQSKAIRRAFSEMTPEQRGVGKWKISEAEFRQKLASVPNGKLSTSSKYQGGKAYLEFTCSLCDTKWTGKTSYVLSKGCSTCYSIAHREQERKNRSLAAKQAHAAFTKAERKALNEKLKLGQQHRRMKEYHGKCTHFS